MSSGLTTDDPYLDNNWLFDSALGDRSAGNEPTLYSNISPDAVEPRVESTHLNLAPETERAESLEYHPHCTPQQPVLDSHVELYPTSDFDFGLDSYTFPSFPDKMSNTAPESDNTTCYQHSISSWFKCSAPSSSQALSSFSSGLLPRPSESGTSCAPLALSQPPNELQSSVSTSSQMLLPPLSRLQCPHCPCLLLDRSQLE